jgi:hypothetical protein
MARLVAAEWLKLRTTRILWGAVPAVVLLSAVAVAGLVLSSEVAGVALLEPTEGVRNAALHLTSTGATLVMVLGIIISAGEYRTQTATDTFLTTPRRSRVVAAKLAIGGILGLGLGALSAAVGVPVAYLWFEAEGVAFPAGDVQLQASVHHGRSAGQTQNTVALERWPTRSPRGRRRSRSRSARQPATPEPATPPTAVVTIGDTATGPDDNPGPGDNPGPRRRPGSRSRCADHPRGHARAPLPPVDDGRVAKAADPGGSMAACLRSAGSSGSR